MLPDILPAVLTVAWQARQHRSRVAGKQDAALCEALEHGRAAIVEMLCARSGANVHAGDDDAL